MEVVHADFSPVWRGGQQQLLLLARELRALGWEQSVIAPAGPVAERLRQAGIEVVAPGGAARRRARQAALVHAHDGHAHSWMLRALWRAPARRVLSRRVAYAIPSPFSRWKFRQLDLVLAVSAAAAAPVRATGLAPERVVVIPDGIALADLPPEPTRLRLRAEYGIAPTAPCLVCVGALTAEKGVEVALEALARLPAHVRLLLPGSGDRLPALRHRAQALGCLARVQWGGEEKFSMAEWVAAGDLLVVPSRSEGLGSAAMLAMAQRRPVVASRTGGLPELIEDGVTGLLVPPGDPAALADACARLLADPALAAALGAAARARIEQRYTAAHMAAATAAAYNSLFAYADGGQLPCC